MKKMNDINTVTYSYNNEFYVDIVYTELSIDCWLYMENSEVKKFMFGIVEPRPDNEQTIIEIILSNIENYIPYYIKKIL